MTTQRAVERDAEVFHQPTRQTVLRRVGDAQGAKHGRQAVGVDAAGIGQVLTEKPGRAGARQAHAGQHFEQFALAIARNTGDGDDFPGAYHEVQIVKQSNTSWTVQAQMLHLEQRGAAGAGTARQVVVHLAADHQLRQGLTAAVGCIDFTHHLARAHHGHTVGDSKYFLQLVRDQDDGLALIAEQAQDLEQ